MHITKKNQMCSEYFLVLILNAMHRESGEHGKHWAQLRAAPGLVLLRGGHQEAPLVGHAALPPGVRLRGEAAAAAGPVALVVAVCHHVRQAARQRLDLVVEPAAALSLHKGKR